MAFFFVDWEFRNEALLLCLAFDHFMHTDKFLSLTAGQFTFNMRRLEMHIFLPKTTTSQRKGRTESLHVTEPLLVLHFKSLCRHLEPCDRLLTVSQSRFRQLFNAAVAHCGSIMDIKPYSLHRGGATAFFNTHDSYARAMEVGQLSDSRTSRIYVDTALLGLAQMSTLSKPLVFKSAAAFTILMQDERQARGV